MKGAKEHSAEQQGQPGAELLFHDSKEETSKRKLLHPCGCGGPSDSWHYRKPRVPSNDVSISPGSENADSKNDQTYADGDAGDQLGASPVGTQLGRLSSFDSQRMQRIRPSCE
jgi:hypothetical protein